MDSFPNGFLSPGSDGFNKDGERYLHKNLKNGEYEILLAAEPRIANSNKVFNAFILALETILESITEHTSQRAQELTDDYLHNIIKIHGNQKSIIERCVADSEGQTSYRDFVAATAKSLQKRPGDFAEDICALSKEIRLVDYHIGGHKLLKDSSRISITDNHDLKKFLLGLSHLFFESLSKKGVLLELYKMEDGFRCSFEYETFNIAMHNFIENIVKYAQPKSTVTVSTNSIERMLMFQMLSIKIEPDEKEHILQRGVHGTHVPREKRGSGIGMYQMKKALDRSGILIDIVPDQSQSFDIDGIKYGRNTFIFHFPMLAV